MKKLLALVLCLLAVFCFAMAEEAQPTYTEDFEDGTHDVYLTDNCEAGCIAEVAEEDGNKYLHVVTNTGDAENGYVQVAFGPEVRNFDYTVRVRPYIKNPDWNWMKVILRGLDGTTIEMVGDGYENEAYLFNIWEWRGVFAIKSLQNRKSENTALVENQDFWFDNGTWYTLKVEARENSIRVYVDGELCVEYTDEENIRPEGIFGFCSWGANFDVDDISIVSYDAPKAESAEVTAVEEPAEAAGPAGPVNMLPLIVAEAGNITANEDGSVRVAGRNADNTADAYTDSWHILQKHVSDFELTFDYTPQLTAWNMDRICFRCAKDENGWNQYQLLLFGDQFGEGASGVRIVKGEAMDPAFGYYNMAFEAGKTYEFKLVVTGSNAKVYLGEELIIDAELPTVAGGEYHDEYIGAGDFQVISWAGDFTMTHMEMTELPAVAVETTAAVVEEKEAEAKNAPVAGENGVYDLLPFIAAESGNVTAVENGVRVAGRSADFTGDAYTNTWLIMQKKVADFELTFDYTPAMAAWNMDRVCFRCAGDENEWNQYQLLLFGSEHGEGVSGLRVVKGEALDPAFGYHNVKFEAGVTYELKLAVKGENVKVYLGEELVIDVVLPTAETEEYHDMYIAEGDIQLVSWAGDFVISHMELKEIAE
ncbi:MAG: hypothetical protein IJ343_14960 [Clostridia bacterium]|nr:hypothetical protein [Clostridia bacterium]